MRIKTCILAAIIGSVQVAADELPLPSLFAELEANKTEEVKEAPKAETKPEVTPQVPFWLADPEVPAKMPGETHDDYLDRITAPKSNSSSTTTSRQRFSDDVLRVELQEIKNALNYLYLTSVNEKRVREIVREELAKVNIRYADSAGTMRSKVVSIGSDYVGRFHLNPGETLLSYTDPVTGRLVHVNNSPAKTISLPSQSRPVTYYSTPTTEVFMTSPATTTRIVRGAIRVPVGARRVFYSSRITSPVYRMYASGAVCTGPNCP